MSYNSKYTGAEVEQLLDNIQCKVDKVDGKQLSTEDFTSELKQKLENYKEISETTITEYGFTKNIGTITGINMNGESRGTSGIIDLGNVLTSHQDISSKQDVPTIIEVTTQSPSLTLNPNTIYNCTTEITDITINEFNTRDNNYDCYTVLFKTGELATLVLPANIYWAVGDKPDIESFTEYELSISKRVIGTTIIFKAILLPFKTV